MAAKKGRSVNVISFRAQEFEIQELNIVDYTKCLLSRNEPQGIHLSHEEVFQLFEADVRATYDPEDPKCQYLLQQKTCPLIMDFWEKYKEPLKFISRKSKEARTSFRALPRDRQNPNKGSIVLGDGITKVLIPDIGLLSLQNLSYLDVILKVYQANGSDYIFETSMGRIWVGIVSNVFHFEVESMKVAKVAETISKDVKDYWRRVSDYRMALRQQRTRPVAANFFDDYPIQAQEQPGPYTTMVDMEADAGMEEQLYAGFNSRFRNTFGPGTPLDANGTIMNISNYSQAYDVQASNEHSQPSAPYQSESYNAVETQARFHKPVLTNQIYAAADGYKVGGAVLSRSPLMPSVRSMQEYLSLQPRSSLPIRPRHHDGNQPQ